VRRRGAASHSGIARLPLALMSDPNVDASAGELLPVLLQVLLQRNCCDRAIFLHHRDGTDAGTPGFLPEQTGSGRAQASASSRARCSDLPVRIYWAVYF
jgi:hypothetical protein